MKKKETNITFEQDAQSTFHQKLDRELDYSLKMKHSTRDKRYKRTPYDELREQGNLNADYLKEQFAYISEKQSKLPSRTRRVIVYEITLAVRIIMAREKALEAKQTNTCGTPAKSRRAATPSVMVPPGTVIAGTDPQSQSNTINEPNNKLQ